ncbi:MAG: glycoside hydrolase family 5 protein [Arcicella sp.]|nr:glycoside hydrolase family 5 protein [Arcicella sp.]
MLNQMKFARVFGLGIATSVALLLSSCSESISPEEKKVDAIEEANFTNGNGVNLQPSYTNSGNVNAGWNFMKNYPKIKAVRIEINPEAGGGEATQVANAARLIKEAHTNGYQVIATYHPNKLGDESTNADIQNAGRFWKNYYDNLSSNGTAPFIINLINEWGPHAITAQNFATQVNAALANVYAAPVNARDGGTGRYNKQVIIDAPGYGQETYTLKQAVPLINATYRGKLILSAHIYPSCYVFNRPDGSKGPMYANDLAIMGQAGLPCMLGEFGSYAKDGGGANWSTLVDYAKNKSWPVFAWAWCGDGTGKLTEGRGLNGKGMNMVDVKYEPNTNWSYGNFKIFGDNSAYTAAPYMATMINKL